MALNFTKEFIRLDNNANVFFLTAASDFSEYKGGNKPLAHMHCSIKAILRDEIHLLVT
jgi:hypothetical protein